MNQQMDIDGPDRADEAFEAWLDECYARDQQERDEAMAEHYQAQMEYERMEREMGR